MNILVTGGAGFIGSHLVDALVARKHTVHVWDDMSSGWKAFLNPKARFTKMDVASPAAERAVARLKPDIIFHLAAQKDVRFSVSEPVADATTNVIGLLRLVQGAIKAGGLKKFVFASTGGAMYGGAEQVPTPETFLPRPLSPYGASKLASEAYLGAYRTTGMLPSVCLRFANVYGPRQTAKAETGVVSVWAERLLKGQRPIVYGNGKQTRDFVYVADVVRALVAAMRPGMVGTYNIGTGKETSLNQLLAEMRAVTDASLKPVYAPAKLGEERRSAVDPRLAAKALGWKPEVSLEQGVAKTVAWMRGWAAHPGKEAHGGARRRK